MKITRYDQVASKILSLIDNGVLKAGDKIPSIRQLSQELNVSKNTVQEAYWKLENQNYIEAVPQSGFYVKKQAPVMEEPLIDPAQWDPQDMNLIQIYGAFQNIDKNKDIINLGIAGLNSQFWPKDKLSRFIQEALRYHEFASYDYLMCPGYLELRKQIARHGISRGLNLSHDDIIITGGCHEAVFLALMVLCKPGDTVVVESPIYFNMIHLLKQLQLRIIEIPNSSDEGIHLDTFEFILENYPVKAVFLIPSFNNPLGSLMPDWKKEALVRMLDKADIPLIEDDVYGDLYYHHSPKTCKSYDRNGKVILCSSFSKTIAPGLRIGWTVAGKYHDDFLRIKTLFNLATPSINQIAVAGFLKEGGYERHLRKLRQKMHDQLTILRNCILDHFPKTTKATDPQGGFLFWVELPETVDTYYLYQEAIKKNIFIAPGKLFSMKDKYSHCLRMNAGIWNEQVEAAIEYLAELSNNNL